VPSGASAEDLITAKLVREFYTPLWNGKAVPEWFLAGLEQLYSPTPKNPLLSPVQQAARAGTLLTLPEMELADESALWRAQSFGMMLYLFDQLGMRGVFDLARVDAEDFPTAYESAIDTPLTALIPAWSQWIFSRSAESLYGITPYQPPTPLPSPTLTPSTTRRPTLTPSPTFTPSLAATPTPRGVRTYTPPPTVTPSETLPPPPPTVTPRPPGSLQPLTPTPTALQVTLSQPGVQAGAITFLLLLLGLLVFVFIRLGNRR
jgi:hypothetical protein